MSTTFPTTPTRRHGHRPAHPSQLPPLIPTLVEVAEAPPAAANRRLPGGAVLVERRPNPAVAELVLVGEVDVFDRGALVDACTAVGLEGARHLRIEGSGLEFVDLRILEALAKVAAHSHRIGGSFELTGLREPFCSMWAGLAPDTAVPAPAERGRLDDRVVPLRAVESADDTETPEKPALRVVPDIGSGGADSATRPA